MTENDASLDHFCIILSPDSWNKRSSVASLQSLHTCPDPRGLRRHRKLWGKSQSGSGYRCRYISYISDSENEGTFKNNSCIFMSIALHFGVDMDAFGCLQMPSDAFWVSLNMLKTEVLEATPRELKCITQLVPIAISTCRRGMPRVSRCGIESRGHTSVAGDSNSFGTDQPRASHTVSSPAMPSYAQLCPAMPSYAQLCPARPLTGISSDFN